MDKLEYEKLRQDIITRLGKPEYDEVDTRKPLNESARELRRLFSAFQSERMKAQAADRKEKKALLSDIEQKQTVSKYKSMPSIPFDLSEHDLEPFTPDERNVLIDYFHNTNLSPSELERPGFSRQKVVGLMRSGLFNRLHARVFEHILPFEVKNAVIKGIRNGEKSLIERFAEHTGVLKDQTMNLNVNKPIDDPEVIRKLKELGDSV